MEIGGAVSGVQPKRAFLTCQGTRGDVQPYLNLAMTMIQSGWEVTIGAPEPFRSMVEANGVSFIDIGPSPTNELYRRSVAPKKGLGVGQVIQSMQYTKQLFLNPNQDDVPFTYVWFEKILQGCRDIRPDLLVLVFTSWCGAAVIPKLLNLNTQVMVSYPMPMAPTSEFAMSMSGVGFSFRFGVVNSWQWNMTEDFIVKGIHLKAARKNIDLAIQREADAGRPLPGAKHAHLDSRLNCDNLTHLFAFSPALLPKPKDWPASYHVIGQLKPTHKRKEGEAKPLPPQVASFIREARNDGCTLVYMGFGSLGFFEQEHATAILDSCAATICHLAEKTRVRAVIQTTQSSTPGKNGTLTHASKEGTSPFVTFSEIVDHQILFSMMDVVVSHGGIGTQQVAIAAGKPVVSVCCLPSADQSFWADLCYRKELGPKWMWVSELIKSNAKPNKKLASRLKHAIENLEKFTKNATDLRTQMLCDDANSAALRIIEEQCSKAGSSDQIRAVRTESVKRNDTQDKIVTVLAV